MPAAVEACVTILPAGGRGLTADPGATAHPASKRITHGIPARCQSNRPKGKPGMVEAAGISQSGPHSGLLAAFPFGPIARAGLGLPSGKIPLTLRQCRCRLSNRVTARRYLS